MFKVQGIRTWTHLGLFVSPLQRASWPAPPKVPAFSLEYRTPTASPPTPLACGVSFLDTRLLPDGETASTVLVGPWTWVSQLLLLGTVAPEFRNKVQNLETKISAAVDSPLVPLVQLVPTPAWEPCPCLGPEK